MKLHVLRCCALYHPIIIIIIIIIIISISISIISIIFIATIVSLDDVWPAHWRMSRGMSMELRVFLPGNMRRHDSAPPVARPPNLVWSSPPSRACQRAQSASTLGAPGCLQPLNGSMPWCPKIQFERPCSLHRQKKSQAMRSASASCTRLAPLAEDARAGAPPSAGRSCSEGPAPGAVLARSLAIPEEGRVLRLEPSDADDEFCKLLTAALAAPRDAEGYGLEASPPPTPVPGPHICSDADAAKGAEPDDDKEPDGEVTMPPELRQPSQSRPQLTLLPLPGCAKPAAEPPQRSPSCHPFGAKPSSEATPRSMSCETREAAEEAPSAVTRSPRARKPRTVKRRDFEQVMKERRRLLDAHSAVTVPRAESLCVKNELS
ncbi:eff [Symbiodinium natans]|uniref:Eff protein n=1 Tax=Symbiodinium natans TaxID=878477 RepID=A0A812NUX0_9DINO|nr:eff [Symbiodinium natans]